MAASVDASPLSAMESRKGDSKTLAPRERYPLLFQTVSLLCRRGHDAVDLVKAWGAIDGGDATILKHTFFAGQGDWFDVVL
eukprot:1373468-Rhodomonas_salina.2